MKALIFGSKGQDGRCLTELLLRRNYEVVGISKDLNIDLSKPNVISDMIKAKKPDEIYYFAAFHHSSEQKTESELSSTNKISRGRFRDLMPEKSHFTLSFSL